MVRKLGCPAKYIQGDNELNNIVDHLKDLGDNIIFIISQNGLSRVQRQIENSFDGSNKNICFEVFKGECCDSEINRLSNLIKDKKYNVIAGVGGGKILDTAKAVAYYLNLPLAILPTVASTDAPCSSLSIIYKENGEFDRYLYLRKSPDIVIVDTNIILNSPVRLFVSGMGDALSTYFEARAVNRSGKNNQLGGKPTLSAFTIAKSCYDTLLEDGFKAKAAFEANCCTAAVENIIEVNTFLSGVGFESGGLAAAHAIQKGFSFIPQLNALYHGEKVAFCTIVQLIMENAPLKEIKEVIAFCKSVGLPTTFADMNIDNISKEDLELISEKSCIPNSTIHNMPIEIKPAIVYAALLGANAVGRELK